MEKILCVSDLDGTLLNQHAELSPFTLHTLNRLISDGMNFTVATARTAATVEHILNGLHLKFPAILMNGVSLYDIEAKKYLLSHTIPPDALKELFSCVSKESSLAHTGFLYTLQNGVLNTCYENLNTEHAKNFVFERIKKYGKTFDRVQSFSDQIRIPAIYFSVCDILENLKPVYDRISQHPLLHTEFYRDIYEEGFWYLEVCSALASKRNALEWIKYHYSFDKIIAFGDNLNDIPMFSAADLSFAVANAKPEVKSRADHIIASNQEDAVAHCLIRITRDAEATGLRWGDGVHPPKPPDTQEGV